MIRHALFPTLVLEDQYRDADKFKPIFLSKLMNYMTIEGYSNEYTGHVNIHHEEAFAPLFGYITGVVEEYLRTLAIDPEMFDINIVKTWMNITKERHTPFHSHEDAHLSFTYYANIPQDIEKPLVFSSTPPHMNDPYYGMIKFNATETNKFNAYESVLAPSEGNLFVFPAKLSHHTIGYGNSEFDEGCKSLDDLKKKRVCLAGDIFFTYRKVEPKPTGIQPSYNWRIFRK